MNNNNCPQCRTDRKTVIITNDVKHSFEFLSHPQRIVEEEANFGLQFNSEAVYKDTISLLKFNCPYKDCDYIAESGWAQLKTHVRNEHHLIFCPYCTEHKKLFSNEFDLYTKNGLKEHEQQTSPDENGFKGHPLCNYCKIRFYSQDELIPHLKHNHEECFICTRQRPDLPHFFRDYPALEKHFNKEHFVCNVRSCLDKKFVVFASPLELQVHQKTEHPDQYGGRKLDLNLSFDTGRNKTSNRNRSNLSTVTASNTVPPSNNTTSNNVTASVQISHGEAFPVLGASAQSSSSSSAAVSSSSSSSENAAPAPSNWTITPEMAELADRRLRERVRIALHEDPLKFAQFDQINEEFLAGDKNAHNLLEEYRILFPNMNVDELEGVVVGFTKVILRNPIKVKEVNRAWEEYRARMQLPSSAGSVSRSASQSSDWPTPGTAVVHRSGIWGKSVSRKGSKAAAALAQGDTSAFPSLPTANGGRRAAPVAPRIAPSRSSSHLNTMNQRHIPGAGPAYNVYGADNSYSNSGTASKSYANVSGPFVVGSNRNNGSSNITKSSSSASLSSNGTALGSAGWATPNGKGKKLDASPSSFPALSSSASSSPLPSRSSSSSNLDSSHFPALPASNKKRSNAPLTNPLAGSRSIDADEDLVHATDLLRESKLSNNNSNAGSNKNGAKKGKKKKDVLFSYGI